MCKGDEPQKGVWKATDYGINLYPPVPSDDGMDAPMCIDLNERVAEEMKKEIFIYFRHYSIQKSSGIWSGLDGKPRKSEKSHWWSKIKGKYSKSRRKASRTIGENVKNNLN
ncbi:hypothetical protein GE061_008304 [Apolygus lucorum]|uniref:Uncharacterized protein n=1 Tax=Apolygus lucorum TaxID=248454 RepID=A0A6A4IUA6_APOLU|nr:hypothetical protein GE061_008304 [Apolygus lucorum]